MKKKSKNSSKSDVLLVDKKIPQSFEMKSDDYRDFDNFLTLIKKYLGLEYNYEEVKSGYCSYRAFFWIGEKPEEAIKKAKNDQREFMKVRDYF